MTYDEVIADLKSYSSKPREFLFNKHGAKGTSWGVKFGDLQKIRKKIGKDHRLSLTLYKTGISDAQYLAGLVADEQKITKTELQDWAQTAESSVIIEYAVPWIAADSGHGWALGLKWVEDKKDSLQCCGWATLANEVTLRADQDLDLSMLEILLDKVSTTISEKENRVRYTMNGFLIAVGCSVEPLSKKALQIGQKLGKIKVDMNGTACKTPYAPDYISKAAEKGAIGKKKKMARCYS
ncbi:MAG: DNA alkylation repair protein [Chitinophagaceae bacterium]